MAQFWIKDEDLLPIKDKVVVVTGGSSGIGLATIEVLLENGAKVVAGDMNECPITNDNLTFVKTDVTSWSELKALFKTAHDKHQRIDHVFSNAGISGRADYLSANYDPSSGELLEPNNLTFDINLRGMINTSYLGLHYMRTQNSPQGGSIVCTASASSFQRFGVTDYTTAKHGVLGFMRGMIPNLVAQKLPIRINSIGPNWTASGLVNKEMLDQIGVPSQPASVVGRKVVYLMADESRNGQFIFSEQGRYYEIEESVLLPAAAKITGMEEVDAETVQQGLEKLAQLSEEMGQRREK